MSVSAHVCHAEGCNVPVPPRMLMCSRHWRRVHADTQRAIWREYRPGQERDKSPSVRYLAVQTRSIAEAAFLPHDEAAAALAARWILFSEIYRRKAIDDGAGDPLEYTGKPPAIDTAEQAREILKGVQGGAA